MTKFILIGPPGAGKSTIGWALSQLLDQPALDVDSLIEEWAGKTISSIFVEDGEEHFRAMERDITLEALQGGSTIVSLGGGAVMTKEIAAYLSNSGDFVVFLDVGISNAAPRVGFNRDRPLLLVNPRQQWLSLMEKRRPVYESLATVTVSTDNRQPSEVAEEIVDLWKARRSHD